MKLEKALKYLSGMYNEYYNDLEVSESKMINQYEKLAQERKSSLIWARITSHLIIKHIKKIEK